MTKDELAAVSQQLLQPVDEVLADLFDKSLRYDAERFAREVELAIQQAPSLFALMDIDALAEPLEVEMGRAMVKELSR